MQWEPISEEGDLMCPSCLTAIARDEIDGDALQLASEALGVGARVRPGPGLGAWA